MQSFIIMSLTIQSIFLVKGIGKEFMKPRVAQGFNPFRNKISGTGALLKNEKVNAKSKGNKFVRVITDIDDTVKSSGGVKLLGVALGYSYYLLSLLCSSSPPPPPPPPPTLSPLSSLLSPLFLSRSNLHAYLRSNRRY